MSVTSETLRFAAWLIKYLGFRIWRWLFLSLCFYGVWAGLDGLAINFSSNSLQKFAIEDVEKSGVGGSRYVNITGGIRGDVCVHKERFDQVESILYPVISYNMINKIAAKVALQKETEASLLEHSSLAPDFKIRVMVNWPLSMSTDSLENWVNENLAIEENDLSGIVLAGWDAVHADDTKLLRSVGVTFHEDLILIQKGAKPVSPLLNIIYLLCSLGGLYFLFIRQYLASRKTVSNIALEEDRENLGR